MNFNEWVNKRRNRPLGGHFFREEDEPPKKIRDLYAVDPGEKDLGKAVKKHFDVWQIRFSDIRQDAQEGWYYKWSDAKGSSSIRNFDDLEIGDKVADAMLNMTPYWEISGLDDKREIVYLNPIEPNPFLTGVGAGGHPIGQHDYDVMSGKFEQDMIDGILKKWKDGHVYDPRDVAYLLKGTVPHNMGPNGAQGGWYSSGNTRSNRGGKEGMNPYQIQFMDAMTLKGKFGFDVPKKAIIQPSENEEENEQNKLTTHQWDDFVSGAGNNTVDSKGTEIEGEDFSDAATCARLILTHPQTAIKTRNVIALIELFKTKDPRMKDRHGKGAIMNVKNPRRRQQKFAKMRIGMYTNKALEPLVKETALKFAEIHHPNQSNLGYDPYYLAKEQFIILAGQMGWWDVLRVYEQSPDQDNRRYVYQGYQGTYRNKQRREEDMTRMLSGEEHPNALKAFIYDQFQKHPLPTKKWVEDHWDRLTAVVRKYRSMGKDTEGSYYAKELEELVTRIKEQDPEHLKWWM